MTDEFMERCVRAAAQKPATIEPIDNKALRESLDKTRFAREEERAYFNSKLGERRGRR